MALKRAMMLGLDGADPLVIKKLVDMGRLPNIKKLIESGATCDNMSMIGAFPSVTPPNWASLATGNWPRTHGVTCYHNHTLGKPLDIVELNWDSRRVESEFIWEAFAREGKRCLMLNYCEAWPPRILDDKCVYIDGTGVLPFMRSNIDYQKIITLEKGNFPIEEKLHAVKSSSSDCVVQGDQYKKMIAGHVDEAESLFDPIAESDAMVAFAGMDAHPQDAEADNIHSPLMPAENWERELPADALVAVVPLNGSTVRRYFVLSGDKITIYANRKANGAILGEVEKEKWSGWIFDYYIYEDQKVKVGYKLRWLHSDDDKIRLYVSYAQNLNDYRYTYPQSMGEKLFAEVGPALCFAKYGQTDTTDWPGHQALLESFEQNIAWHTEASNWLFEQYPDWQLYYVHLHSIDLYNHWYINRTIPDSCEDWEKFREILYSIYEAHDVYVGEMMKQLDGNTTIFLCSDHAAIPHSVGDVNPCIGWIPGITTQVMSDIGYTKIYQDTDGVHKIDWSQTKAVFSRTSHVYINLKGRDPEGIVEPEDYQDTVDDLIGKLYNYRHPDTGKRVVAFCLNRNEMEAVGMGGEHCGDILCQLMPTYCEEHANCPTTVEHEGYSLNNLCVIAGAGIKQGYTIHRKIRITDVVPTICYVTDSAMPCNVEGGIIYQALNGFDEREYKVTSKAVKQAQH